MGSPPCPQHQHPGPDRRTSKSSQQRACATSSNSADRYLIDRSRTGPDRKGEQ